MLDLTHIRSFVMLAAELHFGRAARRLNMTQPPLSRQIRALEAQLGVDLFERTSKAVTLTHAGRSLLPRAQALLQQAAEFEGQARGGRPDQTGDVRIGFYGASSYYLLPRLITQCRDRYPGIRILLGEMNGVQQVSAFSLGQIDLGIARPTATPAGVAVYPALEEKLVLALPGDHPLARRRRLRLADLDAQDFIAYHPDAPYMHRLIAQLLGDNRVAPNIVQQATQAQTIMSLVSANLGLAILPETTQVASFSSVAFRPLRDAGRIRAQSNVMVLRDRETHATQCVRELCLELFRGRGVEGIPDRGAA